MAGTAVEDYVKAIYKLAYKNHKVTPSHVAEQLGVSPAAVTRMVRRLQELNLVRYARADGLTLRPAGKKIALEVIRHHRLIELYLTEALGYGWHEVHEEAERLEHVISEQFEDKIEALLGYPTHDPHGAPIPTREGHVETPDARLLSELRPGEQARIHRVSDSSAEMLSYMGELGMYPGTSVEMVAREPFGGPLQIKVSGIRRSVGEELAGNVFITPTDEDDA